MSKRFVPKRGTRGTAEYLYFELSMAQGPRAIGDTGENELLDFIGTAWLLLLTEDMNLHLFRQDATVGEWTEITTALPPVFDSPLPATARRVTFAFDQSARVIVVYEDDGLCYVTRWDAPTNQYVQNVTFAGHDPVVVFDATWAYDIPVSDVLLFHLSTDRERLVCRVQRELFNIENELHDYAQPVVLDRVTRLPLRYQALASDAVGDPLASGATRVALTSDFYPYPYLTLVSADGEAYGAMGHTNELYEEVNLDAVNADGEAYGAMGHSASLFTAEDGDALGADGEAYGAMGHNLTLVVYEDDGESLDADGEAYGTQVHTLTLVIVEDFDDGVVDVDGEAYGTMTHKEA